MKDYASNSIFLGILCLRGLLFQPLQGLDLKAGAFIASAKCRTYAFFSLPVTTTVRPSVQVLLLRRNWYKVYVKKQQQHWRAATSIILALRLSSSHHQCSLLLWC